MNPATEIVLRWLFAAKEIGDDLAEELVSVLRKGCELREDDSLRAVSIFIRDAEREPKEPPYDELIPLAIFLHRELARSEDASHNLSRIQEISRLADRLPASEIGKRVVATRIRALVAELRA